MDQLKEWDEQFFLFLNQFHTDWLDEVVWLITKTEFWIPLYFVLLFLIFKNYKREGWIILAGIALTIVLADQITSGLMKPFFQRLRPSHEPSLQGLVHVVGGYRGGLYGFASSHAANTTGVAFFIFLIFKSQYRWIGLLFIWAFITGYTRIYLGVHYPGDIMVGALIGLCSGYAGYKFFEWLNHKVKSKRKE